jgi:di/tricarboxylate transporter
MPGFNLEIWLTFAVLLFVVIVFIFEWIRVDVVGIIVMVALPLLGLVTPGEAISGLSSNAVVSIIAVMIIGAGLDRTGVMRSLAHLILKFAGRSENRIMVLISAAVAGISGFMQNIGAAALFMPAVKRIAAQTGTPINRILMPMGSCAIIGGCLTLVGSSPLIMLNDLVHMVDAGRAPVGLFGVTPVGVALLATALIYFVAAGRFVLPPAERPPKVSGACSLVDSLAREVGSLYEMRVPDAFEPTTLIGLGIRENYCSSIVAISRTSPREKYITPIRDSIIRGGDHVALVGPEPHILQIAADFGWELLDDLETFADDLSPSEAGNMMAVIAPRSRFFKNTIYEIQIRRTYHVSALAILRGDDVILENITHEPLVPGDALLLHGRWADFHRLKDSPDLILTSAVPGEILKTEKAWHALACLGVSLAMILVFQIQLSIALLFGAAGMVTSRVLTMDEAYQSVEWMTVFLLAGLIPLGMAFQNTGAAQLIADGMVSALGSHLSPVLFLFAVGILSTFFTLVISNVGATVLLVPLCMNMAARIGADPGLTALAVAVAASNSFLLPTHQVNALIMRPGGYRTMDFVKSGAGLTVLYLLVMTGMLSLMYPRL